MRSQIQAVGEGGERQIGRERARERDKGRGRDKRDRRRWRGTD